MMRHNDNTNLVPPFRFGRVSRHITRGSYPTLINFQFLHRLRLNTIISLIPEAPNPDLVDFATSLGIELVHVQVEQTASLSPALMQQLTTIAQLAINSEKKPLYIHCIDGRKITSVFVAIIRKLQGWNTLPLSIEYWSYCTRERAPIPQPDIEKQTKELEKFLDFSTDTLASSEGQT